MKKDFTIPFIISIIIHFGIFVATSSHSQRVVYMTIPVELSFFAPAPASSPTLSQDDPGKNAIINPPKKDDIVIPKKGKGKEKKAKAKRAEQVPEKSEAAPEQSDQLQQTGLGATPGGRGMGSPISVDSKHFPYAYYTNLIVKKIGMNWRWSTGFGQMKAVVYFKVQKNGAIHSAAIKESSGDSLFDQQALRSI